MGMTLTFSKEFGSCVKELGSSPNNSHNTSNNKFQDLKPGNEFKRYLRWLVGI